MPRRLNIRNWVVQNSLETDGRIIDSRVLRNNALGGIWGNSELANKKVFMSVVTLDSWVKGQSLKVGRRRRRGREAA